MEEKYMVNDILKNVEHIIKNYTDVILKTSNIDLRQVLQTDRNTFESFQFELFKLAISKGYYPQEVFSKPEEINNIKKQVTNN